MTHVPTPEQVEILDAVRSTDDNLLVSALAGAAKTTTLVMMAEQLPKANCSASRLTKDRGRNGRTPSGQLRGTDP